MCLKYIPFNQLGSSSRTNFRLQVKSVKYIVCIRTYVRIYIYYYTHIYRLYHPYLPYRAAYKYTHVHTCIFSIRVTYVLYSTDLGDDDDLDPPR